MNIEQFKKASKTWIVCLTIGVVLTITLMEFAAAWKEETPSEQKIPVWRPEGTQLRFEESDFFKSYQRGNCELIPFESFQAVCGDRGTNISVVFQKPDKFHYIFSKDGTNWLAAIKDDYEKSGLTLSIEKLSYDHEAGVLNYTLEREGSIKVAFMFVVFSFIFAVLPGSIIYGALHLLRLATILFWNSLMAWREGGAET